MTYEPKVAVYQTMEKDAFPSLCLQHFPGKHPVSTDSKPAHSTCTRVERDLLAKTTKGLHKIDGTTGWEHGSCSFIIWIGNKRPQRG